TPNGTNAPCCSSSTDPKKPSIPRLSWPSTRAQSPNSGCPMKWRWCPNAPRLLVAPRPEKTVDPASVLALYEGKVAKWWLPDEVVVVPELPHTATGKLLKTSLRTRFRDHSLKS